MTWCWPILIFLLNIKNSFQSSEITIETFVLLQPNETVYLSNSVITKCDKYVRVVNELGLTTLKTVEFNLLFKLQIYEMSSLTKKLEWENKDWSRQSYIPDRMDLFGKTSRQVGATCKDKSGNEYYVPINVIGSYHVQSSLPDKSAVYSGQEIYCGNLFDKSEGPMWLYIGGMPQMSRGATLRIKRASVNVKETSYTSYSCSTPHENTFRSIYTFYPVVFFYQILLPNSRTYNPGDVALCYIVGHTLSDVNKATRIRRNVGYKIITKLRNSKTVVKEHIGLASFKFPDYPEGVVHYLVSCTSDGDEIVPPQKFFTDTWHDTYFDKEKLYYGFSESLQCDNPKIYGTRKLQLVLFVAYRNAIPLKSQDLIYSADRMTKMKKQQLKVTPLLPAAPGEYLAYCYDEHSLLTTTWRVINIVYDSDIIVKMMHPPLDIVSSQVTTIPGAVFKCTGNRPWPQKTMWIPYRGDLMDCNFTSFDKYLYVPKTKTSCIAQYVCTISQEHFKASVIPLTIEVISDYVARPKNNVTSLQYNEPMVCTAYGYSHLLEKMVQIELHTEIWVQPEFYGVMYVGLSLETSRADLSLLNFFIGCMDESATFKGLYSLVFQPNASQLQKVAWDPDIDSPLYTNNIIRCFSELSRDGNIKGSLKISVTKNDKTITLVEGADKFMVPSKVNFGTNTYDVDQVTLGVQCHLLGKYSTIYELDIKTCFDGVDFVEIVPTDASKVHVGMILNCVSSQYCGSAFDYTINAVDANSELSIDGVIATSHNAPIIISYSMMGPINILCSAKRKHGGFVRVSKNIYVEGQPSDINVTRRTKEMVIIPKSTSVAKTNEILLCESYGYPKPNIVWKKISSPANYPDHELYTSDAVISITSFDPPGVYVYACTVKSTLGRVETKHEFTILNKFYRKFSKKNIAMYFAVLACILFITFICCACYIIYGDIYHN